MKKLLLLSFLLVSPAFGEDIQYTNIGPFGGINNSDSPLAIPANKAQDLINVDVSPGGKSVLKRKGFALFSNLAHTTSPVHGVHNFYDSSGNSVDLYFNDYDISASVGGGAVSVLSSTAPLAATWQCVDSQGFAYCNNTGRTSLLKTNGAIFSHITSVNSTGTLVAVTPERLVTSGFFEAPNRIDFSKANDFTSWTIGSAATSAAQFTVVSPGSKITHIVYAFGKIIWFKDSSMGFIYIGGEEAQADWELKIIDPRVGTLDNTSVYWEGILYFRGQDGHIYGFDGSNVEKLTRDLEGTISVSGNRTTGSWSQSTTSEFETSSMTPQGFLSTTLVPNSIVLGTATAISDFTDDSASDFGAADSVVYLDTTTIPGSVYLSTAASSVTGTTPVTTNVRGPGAGTISGTRLVSQSIISTYTFLLSSITVLGMSEDPGTKLSTITFSLAYDNAGYPGGVFLSTGINLDSLTGTPSNVVAVFNSSAVLSSGSTYWLQIATTADSTSAPIFDFVETDTSPEVLLFYNGVSTTTDASDRLSTRMHGYDFFQSGVLTSRAFDNGFSTHVWIWDWDTFYASGTIPTGQSLLYTTQTSSDSSCVNCWDTAVSVSSGASPTSAVKRYIRYKANFALTSPGTSPVLNYVEFNMTKRLRPGGTYYSEVHETGSNLSSWDSFLADKTNNGGTVSFQIRASSTAIGINSSTPAWVNVSAGDTPNISTFTNVQVKAIFAATKSTHSPTLNDFTVQWFEGTASDKSYGTYFNDAIWWSVASGVAVSTNNRILRLDLNNADWYLYDIGTNGMLVRNNSLYFGSSTEGKIFKFGEVDNDNGADINAFWKSKDFVQGNPFVKKEFVNLSLSAGSVANSSMTVTYSVDGSSSTVYQFPLYAGSNFYKHFNKNLPLGRIGNTFNVKFGNSGADQPFEVFAVQYGFRDKSWVPTQ